MREEDRTVFARLGRSEVVRYDRAGTWHLEGGFISRRLNLGDAVDWAIEYQKRGGQVFNGMPGGSAFDRKFKAAAR